MIGSLPPARSSLHSASPSLPGSNDIEHDEIDLGAGQGLHHRAAIGGDRDAIAVLLQEVREQRADLAVVVDDQEVWCRVHGAAQYRAPAGLSQRSDL